ncbi:MAG: hypothetical protein OEM02_09685 [Desulfobulbaceae bacterium]|nr:hypothetical protein [Desulfobulbaceae bacterium]
MKIQEHFLILTILFLTLFLYPVASEAGEGALESFRFNFNKLYFQSNPLRMTDNAGDTGDFLVVQVKDAIKMLNIDEVAGNKKFYSNGVDFISFSYTGSSGVLGFSSGYIGSRGDDEQVQNPKVSKQESEHVYHEDIKNLYVGVDMNHSVALTDDINVGIRAGLIYFEDIYSEYDEDAVSVLFVMPVEINNKLTIEPRIHWTRNLTEQNSIDGNKTKIDEPSLQENNGSFYGGVSISLAY